MRMQRTWIGSAVSVVVLTLGALVALGGCPERSTTQPPVRTVPMGQPTPVDPPRDAPAEQPSTTTGQLAAEDAGTGTPTPTPTPTPTQAEPDPKELSGNLQDFRGFSRDESLFAFTVFSEAAGLHLMHVVQGEEGEVKHRFQLDAQAELEKARAFLREHGFTRKQGELPADVKQGLSLRAVGGKAKVTLKTGADERVIYEGDPFETPGLAGGVQSVRLEHVAPSGRRIAARVEQVPVTEWGGIVGYIVLDLGPTR